MNTKHRNCVTHVNFRWRNTKKKDGKEAYSRLACMKCGINKKRLKHFVDRDLNAARNILEIGISVVRPQCFSRSTPPVAPGGSIE